MPDNQRIGYFTMEVGIRADIPTYSGGLGVLSGDTLRSAADLGAPMVGVTLLYRQGFFRQHLAADGSQSESAPKWEPERFFRPVDTVISLSMEGRNVYLKPWLYTFQGVGGGEVPLYALDANLPENDPEDRALTGQLYGGDTRYRLKQEAILGLGGIAMLRALGYHQVDTFHMNEGHSALLTLALLKEANGDGPLSDIHLAAVRHRCVFTTHTPVDAGHDRFPLAMVREVLGPEKADIIESLPVHGDGILDMTFLALYFARYVNGVARRHGEVARGHYPHISVASITNGVHPATWISDSLAELYDTAIPGWRRDSHLLRQALDIAVEDVMDAHQRAKRALFAEVAQRTAIQLDPTVLTVGFARRAVGYKRADLVFTQPEMLRQIARNVGRLQFVFAGKAHPHDQPAKELIRRVVAAGAQLEDDVPVVYLEEHDMSLGRLLCSGVDLWLNNPQRPLEASGTSGMKAALNGVPSLSVLDGWWPEGWIEGVTGWSIGDGSDDISEDHDSMSIYNKLSYVILPLFYGSPSLYGRVMRSSIAVNGSYFTTDRMLQQYMRTAYAIPLEESQDSRSWP